MFYRVKMVRRWALITSSFVLLASAISAQAPRTRVSLNDNWRFTTAAMVDAEGSTASDRIWQRVNIPHTWNDKDPFDDAPGYRRGPAWYQKTVNIPASYAGRRIFLYFEGANQTAGVFVNGSFVGEHIGGYTAFSFDVTDEIKTGGTNLVAVQVDNTLNVDRPPIDGDFNIYGGIYRDVWLISTDNVHIDMSDMASSGVKIETSDITAETAMVKATGKFVNRSSRKRTIVIENVVVDARGRKLTSTDVTETVDPGATGDFETAFSVSSPKLWSPDSPYLYTFQTTIREGRRVLDRVDNPLGFRTVRFDANEGFFLNGKSVKLRGTNRHQDRVGLGSAVSDNLHVRDLEIIKANGFNFLRLAHYQQDPAVLAAADRLGLMLWEEIPIVNNIHISDAFNANAKQMLTEMIRQHRNHPSVIIWGYMNEVYIPKKPTDESMRATVSLAKKLENVCKNEDPNRTTAIAFEYGGREMYRSSGLDKVTDIIGWNLYYGWYYGVFDDFGKFLDEDHRRNPDKPLIISEYGANADRRVNSLDPKRFDSSTQWQRRLHESYLRQINERHYLAGSAIWNQFDFGSEFRGETIPHVNQKGMYTFGRVAKDIAYLYRAAFSDKKVLHIATRDWPVRSGERSQTIDIYSNLGEVELFANGVSLGKQATADNKAWWTLAFKNGRNLLTARAVDSGRVVTDSATVTYSDPSATNVIAINCGSNIEYRDAKGQIWIAENTKATKPWELIAGNSKLTENRGNILGTDEDQIFQTMREGAAEYKFAVPDGKYEVELMFAEPKHRETSKRLFRYTVNHESSPLIDLVREAGFMQQWIKRIRTRASGGEGITVLLSAVVDEPVISAIRLKKIK